MKTPLTLLLLLSTVCCFAQETEKVTIQNKIPEFREVFYVLKSNPDVKHGKYKKTYTGSYSIIEEGEYENGNKSGVWKFYDNKGKIDQEIDFTNKKITSVKPFVSRISAWLTEGDKLIVIEDENPPVLIGGQSKLNHIFIKYLRYPAPARRMGVDGVVHISGIVTKEGTLIDEKVEKSIGSGLDEEALRIVQLLPDEWLPYGWDTTPVDSKVILQVKFKLN
jgi:TonB family protein